MLCFLIWCLKTYSWRTVNTSMRQFLDCSWFIVGRRNYSWVECGACVWPVCSVTTSRFKKNLCLVNEQFLKLFMFIFIIVVVTGSNNVVYPYQWYVSALLFSPWYHLIYDPLDPLPLPLPNLHFHSVQLFWRWQGTRRFRRLFPDDYERANRQH